MLVKPGHSVISRRLEIGLFSNSIWRCGRVLPAVVAMKRCLLLRLLYGLLPRLLLRLLYVLPSLRILRIDLKLKGWFEELCLLVVVTSKMTLNHFTR